MSTDELYDAGTEDNTDIYCDNCKTVSNYREYLDRPGGYLQKRVCENCGQTFRYPENAKKNDLYNRHAYQKACDGHIVMVLTQSDNSPEYYTTVTVVCPIHNKEVRFELPVN